MIAIVFPGSQGVQGATRPRKNTTQSSRLWQLAHLSKVPIQAIQGGKEVEAYEGEGG
jgi:hypothetical protein